MQCEFGKSMQYSHKKASYGAHFGVCPYFCKLSLSKLSNIPSVFYPVIFGTIELVLVPKYSAQIF